MTDEQERPTPEEEPVPVQQPAASRPAWVGDSPGGQAEPDPGQPGASEPVVEHEADPEAEADAQRQPEPSSDLAPGGRGLPLRLARLHLRMGSLALARAELESFAGAGTLDEHALLDLAEARWRTGDLAGAGEAANAAIGRGVDDPLALVIAAEAVAGLGRPAEARRLAGRALEVTGATLDVLFAGMPRSTIWPGDPAPDEALGEAGAPGAAVVVRGRLPEASAPASAAAAEAFAGGRGALARSDTGAAAVRLGVAIRLEPGFAQAVLAAIGDRASTEPALALVAGDALRLLGREHEALAAFDVARGKPQVPRSPAPAEPEPPWTGD
ncbi:MAG TPA: hypothetical protein VES19_14480 [Candidatus Limnocylindrales bacterium]|nr:hypothetical protein [Candidatus Limnocylindrales bacterium]